MGPTLVAMIFASASLSAQTEQASWLMGFWQLTQDEDGSPSGTDLNEFRADGRYVIYGPNCKENFGAYHLYNGDVYIAFDIPGKGPVAMIYRPSEDHAKLTFTSPRTRHNAVYERASSPHVCDRG